MSHQTSSTEYKIRINGSPVAHWSSIDSYFLDEFAKVCKDNPNDSVDFVMVRTEIIMNQFNYDQMKKHFKENSE